MSKVALIDCIPISSTRRADARFATAWWHWFFFAQPALPERVINADPDAWYHGDPKVMGQENYAEWRVAMHDQLWSGACWKTIERDCPLIFAMNGRIESPAVDWSSRYLCCGPLAMTLEELYGDPLAIWRDWARGCKRTRHRLWSPCGGTGA